MLGAPTGTVVEVDVGGGAPTAGAVVAVVPVEPVVLLGLLDAGGADVAVVLVDVVLVDVVLVVDDFGGGVVVVVVVTGWETGLVFGDGNGGYWVYRAPKPRKATTIERGRPTNPQPVADRSAHEAPQTPSVWSLRSFRPQRPHRPEAAFRLERVRFVAVGHGAIVVSPAIGGELIPASRSAMAVRRRSSRPTSNCRPGNVRAIRRNNT